MVVWYEPQSHRATEPQSHRATEPQSHRAYSSALLVIFSLLLAITLPSCANVKGLFTEDRNPPNGPLPDPDCLGEAEGDFQAGEGTEASPYLVCTYEQLKKIGEGLDKHYEQGNKIDASPSYGEGEDSCNAYNGMTDTVLMDSHCAGWIPLGDSSDQFRGSFNGRGYVISKLYANVSSDSGNAYAGLFGYLHGNASISNVGLTELRISATCSASADSFAGGLVGTNQPGTTISNSYAAGSVTANTTGGAAFAITPYAGGLVGQNEGTISNSYAASSVEAYSSIPTFVYAGGLVGENEGTISNSYAAGSVQATAFGGGRNKAYAGGLVGTNQPGTTISNSYATALTEGSSDNSVDPLSLSLYLGGLVGDNNVGMIDNDYYDTVTTGLTAGCGEGACAAVGLRTEQMKATSGTPDEYPSRLGPAFSLGDGYPKLYKCEIDPMTNACAADSFLSELVPGQ